MKPFIKYALVAGGVVAVGAGAAGIAFYFMTNPKEVYNATPVSGSVDKTQAAAVAKKFGLFGMFGAKLATKSQLAAAHKSGAGWCHSGWVMEDDGKTVKDAQYPTQELDIDPDTQKPTIKCGAAHTVNTCAPPTCDAGVVIYGKKPKRTATPVKGYIVYPWNLAEWSKPKMA